MEVDLDGWLLTSSINLALFRATSLIETNAHQVAKLCVSITCAVYRCFGEADFSGRTLLSGRLFHYSSVLRRRLPQSQLAWQADYFS